MIASVFRAMKNMRGCRTFATNNGKDLYFPKYGCSLYEYQDDPVIRKKFYTTEHVDEHGSKYWSDQLGSAETYRDMDAGPKEKATTTTRIAGVPELRKRAALRELINDLENRIEYDDEFGSGHPANVKKREEEKKQSWKPPEESPYGGRED